MGVAGIFFSAPALALDPPGVSAVLRSPQAWVDETGAKHLLADWSGQPLVLAVAYSECRKTCPLVTRRKLEEIQKRLEKEHAEAQFLVVTLDPENDDPPALKRWKDRWAEGRKNWHFLRGSSNQVRHFASAIGAGNYWRMDDHIVHSFRIVYVNSTGETRAIDSDNEEVEALFRDN